MKKSSRIATAKQRADLLPLVRRGESISAADRSVGLAYSTARTICVEAGVRSKYPKNYGPTHWRTVPCITRRAEK